MVVEQVFSPREIMRDWRRFGGAWIQFIDIKTDQDCGKGLVELRGVDAPGRTRSWASTELEWTESDGRHHEGPPPEGCRPLFTPEWNHKGYSMIALPGGLSESCVWASLSPVRQYQYGLHSRAFATRCTTSLYRLGSAVGLSFMEASLLWTAGPRFKKLEQVDVTRANALSPTLGVHPVVEGIGALCWNAKHCIGFLQDGVLQVEDRARPLTKTLQASGAINYVTTSVLTDFYKTTILPRTQRGSSDEVRELPITARELRRVSGSLRLRTRRPSQRRSNSRLGN